MYKILIADDEPWAAYGLSHLIHWEDYGFTICDIVYNGNDALEKHESLKPDVIISDIRMPGKDGLQLIEQLRRQESNTFVVFVSGYSDFEYAQKALFFGAFDYLVKQVTPDMLLGLLKRLRIALDEKTKRQDNWDTWFNLLEDSELSISKWLTINEHPCYDTYFIMTFFSPVDNYHNIPTEHWSNGFMQIILNTAKDKTTILVGYKGNEGENEWNILSSSYGNIYCGISLPGSGKDTFADLYRQSDIAFHTSLMRQVASALYYKPFPKDDSQMHHNLYDLDSALAMKQYKAASQIIQNICSLAPSFFLDYLAFIYNSMNHLFISNHIPSYAYENIENYDYRKLAQEYETPDVIFRNFSSQFENVEEADSLFAFDMVLKYIDEHYTQELRIAKLADQFHFTSSYFSTLFRKKTGTTISKYITDKRIQLAMNYLSTTNMPIKEIADQTGYSDYFQFNKIFKKTVGISPSTYRSTQSD